MRRSWVWGLLLGAAVGVGGAGCKSSKMSGSGAGAPSPAPAAKKPDVAAAPVPAPAVATPDAPARPADWCNLRFFSPAVRKRETCEAFAERINAAGRLFVPFVGYTKDDLLQLLQFPFEQNNKIEVLAIYSADPAEIPDAIANNPNFTFKVTPDAKTAPVYKLLQDLLNPPASVRKVDLTGDKKKANGVIGKITFGAPKKDDGGGLVVEDPTRLAITLNIYGIADLATADILGTDMVTWFCIYNGDVIEETQPEIVKGGIEGTFAALSEISKKRKANADAKAKANAAALQNGGEVDSQAKYSLSALWKRAESTKTKVDITEPFEEVADFSTMLNGSPLDTSIALSKTMCRLFSDLRGTSRMPSGY